MDTEDDRSLDDDKSVTPQSLIDNKTYCVMYSSNDQVRFKNQTYKLYINSDVMTSFAALRAVPASGFGRLRAKDQNQELLLRNLFWSKDL